MDSREATSWYPDWMYEIMESDEVRNKQYREVINSHVSGKTVLELGTGRKALWASYCAAQGAKAVYAIEANEKSFHSSKSEVERKGLHQVHLINGFSDQVSVPERCDVLVHDLVGSIGSNEGMVPFIEDAKIRLLKPNAVHIPWRCTTYFFPTALPQQTLAEQALGFVVRGGKTISSMRSMFMYGYRQDAMLAEPQAFEDLILDQPMSLETHREYEFVVQKNGCFDGLAFFIRLYVDRDHVIDSLASRTNWHIPYIRPFVNPVAVRCGDIIQIACSISLKNGNPTYSVICRLRKGGAFVEVGKYTWSGV